MSIYLDEYANIGTQSQKVMMESLQNKNPTETEKLFFRYTGLYLIEETEDNLKYAPVHLGNYDEFPYEIKDKSLIEYESTIIFDKLSETVLFDGNYFFDIDMITLIGRRMEELNFKRVITVKK